MKKEHLHTLKTSSCCNRCNSFSLGTLFFSFKFGWGCLRAVWSEILMVWCSALIYCLENGHANGQLFFLQTVYIHLRVYIQDIHTGYSTLMFLIFFSHVRIHLVYPVCMYHYGSVATLPTLLQRPNSWT
jgi:hypothetical protein